MDEVGVENIATAGAAQVDALCAVIRARRQAGRHVEIPSAA